MSSSGRTRAMFARRALPVLVSGVAGLALWAGLVVGRIGDEPVPVAFWASAFVTLAVVGVLTDASAAAIAVATFTGPLIASLSTAPRGDNDGLWTLIIPTIAVAAALGGWLLSHLRRVVPAWRLRHHAQRLSERYLVLLVGVVVAGAGGTMWLLAERQADPYPELEELTATFPAPSSLDHGEVRRGGDPLCEGICRAFIERTFSTAQAPAQACDTIAEALDRWHEADVTQTAPIRDPAADHHEGCAWRVEIAGTNGLVAVNDEPDGTTVSVQVFDPNGATSG